MNKLIAALLFSAALPWAMADTFKGNSEACMSFAEFAASAVDVRDAGIGWAEFEAWLKPALERSLESPNSYVQTREEAAYVYSIMHGIWESQDDALMVMNKTYESCMQ